MNRMITITLNDRTLGFGPYSAEGTATAAFEAARKVCADYGYGTPTLVELPTGGNGTTAAKELLRTLDPTAFGAAEELMDRKAQEAKDAAEAAKKAEAEAKAAAKAAKDAEKAAETPETDEAKTDAEPAKAEQVVVPAPAKRAARKAKAKPATEPVAEAA